ncbi:MAG: alpha/beta hydrolase [Kiritimatiellae bacterium]|nr:alpha/beta hydrolase [Kiritimatiellia bacterium]
MKTCWFVIVVLVACQTSLLSAEWKEEKNIPYYTEEELNASGDEYQRTRCKLDVRYLDGGTNLPVLVWFHGGGLSGGNKHFKDLGDDQVLQVAVNYRLGPRAAFPAYLEDAARAVVWTLRSISRYGGDPKRVIVSGHSAGGYLSAMIALDSRWLAKFGSDPKELLGAAPISGQMTEHFNVKKWMGDKGPQYRPLINERAPMYYLSSEAIPICLIVGDREIEWACRVEENQLMAVSLKKLGAKRVEFHEIPRANHGSVGKMGVPVLRAFIQSLIQQGE